MKQLGLALALAIAATPGDAGAQCSFDNAKLDITDETSRIIARLADPPHTRVTLSIDADVGAVHKEVVWDPTVGDGLQHDVLLPKGKYHVTVFADDDRVQTGQLVVITTTTFKIDTDDKAKKAAAKAKGKGDDKTNRSVAFKGTQTMEVLAAAKRDPVITKLEPRLEIDCDSAQVAIGELHLDARRLYAASVARGLLDQTVPAPLTDTLALLAEIAMERAKEGALELVRQKFVAPLCHNFDLALLGLGTKGKLAFPRACGLLTTMRLEDLLSAGRNLVDAARDDVRLTLIPAIVENANLPPTARDIAQVALKLGNEMLDGGGARSAELDLLVTQLDKIFGSSTAGSLPELTKLFDVKQALAKKTVVVQVLQALLPQDPGALASKFVSNLSPRDVELARGLHLADTDACKRTGETATGGFYRFVAARKDACVQALAAKFADAGGITQLLDVADEYGVNVDALIARVNEVTGEHATFWEWLEKERAAKDADVTRILSSVKGPGPTALQAACAVRVVIGVVKWCSGRDSCSAGDIGAALDKPESVFRSAGDDLDNLCWDGAKLRMPQAKSTYVALASRAMGFLIPPAKGDEAKRVEAVVTWVFDLARSIEDATSAPDARSLEKLEEVFQLFARHDYVRGVSQALLLANHLQCPSDPCPIHDELTKTMNLVGAIASYVQVYDDTKSLSVDDAKAARKKALESLIDSATDRTHRRGNTIYTFGSPVGFAVGGRWTPGTSSAGYKSSHFADAYVGESAFTWRVPLVLAIQWMPPENCPVGWHLGLELADLGNFVRGSANGASDSVKWSDFVEVGAQAGMLIGDGKHSLVLAGDITWSPGLYERDVVIMGHTTPSHLSGALTVGLTLAYYVPFFDFN